MVARVLTMLDARSVVFAVPRGRGWCRNSGNICVVFPARSLAMVDAGPTCNVVSISTVKNRNNLRNCLEIPMTLNLFSPIVVPRRGEVAACPRTATHRQRPVRCRSNRSWCRNRMSIGPVRRVWECLLGRLPVYCRPVTLLTKLDGVKRLLPTLLLLVRHWR